MTTIALLTDFGDRDIYTGVMKGIIAQTAERLGEPIPDLIDLSHQVQAGNISEAAIMLRSAYKHFPDGTVFLVVVDPGVGTDRRAIAVKTSQAAFVAPDNGVLSLVLEDQIISAAIELNIPPDSSATFHGRDVFAPAAASLACGMPLTALGSLIGDILRLPVLKLSNTPPNTVTGEVIFIDHFGNLMTNIGLLTWKSPQVLILDEPTVPVKRDISALQSLVAYEDHHVAGIRSTYGMSSVGDLLALVNSDGYLELAINQGNAAEHLAARVGDKVRLILPS